MAKNNETNMKEQETARMRQEQNGQMSGRCGDKQSAKAQQNQKGMQNNKNSNN